MTTLILPGLGSSGPEHWQSRWERLDPALVRVEQAEWDAPRCADWVATVDAAIAHADEPVVLVAHSSSCALIAHWVQATDAAAHARVRGALLVGPSDPTGPHYPAGPTGFAPVPLVRLPFASIVVASTDDIYVTLERAREYASAWGSRFESLGARGHINAASGLGDWPEGRVWLDELVRGAA
jgi:predicted alpha/beta hydrolase family esterase